jgi:hypothetical protein
LPGSSLHNESDGSDDDSSDDSDDSDSDDEDMNRLADGSNDGWSQELLGHSQDHSDSLSKEHET